jgi:hypothetical protein
MLVVANFCFYMIHCLWPDSLVAHALGAIGLG